MKISETKLPGVLLIQPDIYDDNRGFFYESFNIKKYLSNHFAKPFVQDNISRSKKNVVRGLHYQLLSPQAKLVSVIRGAVYDVVVDVRKNSPTFGQWFGQILSDENHLQMYIPEGYAHGFGVLSEEADFLYKCTDYYSPQGERGIKWNDSRLNIDWPIHSAILSKKDEVHPCLHNLPENELPFYSMR